MRILHIITGLQTGGAERMLLNFIACSGQQAVENGVITLTEGGGLRAKFEAADAVLYGSEGQGRGHALRGILIWRQTLKKFRPHILQGWMYHGNLAALMISKVAPHKIPVVWNIRHSLHQIGREKKSTLAVNLAGAALSFLPAKIIYNSQVSRGQHERLGYACRRSATIPNGFDLDHYQPDAQAAQRLRRYFGLPPETLLVGHVARYHPMKDHLNFLHAARKVAEALADVRFLMAGHGINSENTALSDAICRLKLQAHVILLDEQNEMAPILAGLDCLVLSSAWGEAFPNVIGEAMACGTPCIATSVGDCAHIIRDTGYTVAPGNPGALAQAMIRFLSTPAEDRRCMGGRARRLIQKDFSLDSIVKRYQTLYRSILNKSQRATDCGPRCL